MDMETQQSYLTNWDALLLCKCKKQGQCLRIHECIAREISLGSVALVGDHSVCERKNVAIQVMIPARLNGAEKKIIRITGRSLSTVLKDGEFITVLEFLQFEDGHKKLLENDLHQRFENPFLHHLAH